MASETSAQVANNAYLWVYVIIGIVTLLGTGGMVGLVRWLKRQGIRDAQIDRVVLAVLGDDTPDHKSLQQRLDAQDRAIDKAIEATQSNGLNTNQVGDIAKRTENIVTDLRDEFKKHLGSSDEVHRQMWREIRSILGRDPK